MDTGSSRDIARHIIRRLGEAGQPPEHGIMRINVGNESYLNVLSETYFDDLLRHGSAFKVVEGSFGAGKSHFLRCVRELAWARDFACAIVELSPEECPYDDSERTYAAVARNVAIPGKSALEAPRAGIGEVLQAALLRKQQSLVDLEIDANDDWTDPDPRAIAQARQDVWVWLDEMESAPCESLSYKRAVVAYLKAWLHDDRTVFFPIEAWLRAEPVPLTSLREHGIFETISRKNGFMMLRSMTQMLNNLDLSGVALLFDEVDRNLSFSLKRTQLMGDNLRQVVDLCGRHQLPKTLFMYAVPPEFMRTVVPDYPALYQRLKSPAAFGVKSPQSVVIDLDELDMPPAELLATIGTRILEVLDDADMGEFDFDIQRRNARLLAAACVHTQFEINHRRLFVKLFVSFVLKQFSSGETQLTEDDAIDLVFDEYEPA